VGRIAATDAVPINPDYRAGEIAYVLEHIAPDLVLVLDGRAGQMREAVGQSAQRPDVVTRDAVTRAKVGVGLAVPGRKAKPGEPGTETAAS